MLVIKRGQVQFAKKGGNIKNVKGNFNSLLEKNLTLDLANAKLKNMDFGNSAFNDAFKKSSKSIGKDGILRLNNVKVTTLFRWFETGNFENVFKQLNIPTTSNNIKVFSRYFESTPNFNVKKLNTNLLKLKKSLPGLDVDKFTKTDLSNAGKKNSKFGSFLSGVGSLITKAGTLTLLGGALFLGGSFIDTLIKYKAEKQGCLLMSKTAKGLTSCKILESSCLNQKAGKTQCPHPNEKFRDPKLCDDRPKHQDCVHCYPDEENENDINYVDITKLKEGQTMKCYNPSMFEVIADVAGDGFDEIFNRIFKGIFDKGIILLVAGLFLFMLLIVVMMRR